MVRHITPCSVELNTISRNVPCTMEGCQRILSTPSALRMHLQKVHRKFSETSLAASLLCWYHCPQDGCRYHAAADVTSAKHFTTMGSLKQHWLKVHAPRCLRCTYCHRRFSCQRLLAAHQRGCSLPLCCAACPSEFTSLEALQSHCRRNAARHQPTEETMRMVRERLTFLGGGSLQKKLVADNSVIGVSAPVPSGVKVSFDQKYICNQNFIKSATLTRFKNESNNITIKNSDSSVNETRKTCSLRTSATDSLRDKCIGTMSFIMVNRGTNTNYSPTTTNVASGEDIVLPYAKLKTSFTSNSSASCATDLALNDRTVAGLSNHTKKDLFGEMFKCQSNNDGNISVTILSPSSVKVATDLAPKENQPSIRSNNKFITVYQNVKTQFHHHEDIKGYSSTCRTTTLGRNTAVHANSQRGGGFIDSCCNTAITADGKCDVAATLTSSAVPLCSPPSHLLAAIALSELAASAIKKVSVMDACTQTEPECVRHSTRQSHVKTSCRHSNCWGSSDGAVAVAVPSSQGTNTSRAGKRVARSVKRQKSAHTQTRLTHKQSRLKRGVVASTLLSRPSVMKQGIKRGTQDTDNTYLMCKRRNIPEYQPPETDNNRVSFSTENVCVLEAFNSSLKQSCSSVKDLVSDTSNLNLGNNIDIFKNDGKLEEQIYCSNTIHPNSNTDYIVIQAVNSEDDTHSYSFKPQPLSIELPSSNISATSTAFFNSSGTQTSPRGRVSVGIVTCESLYENFAHEFVTNVDQLNIINQEANLLTSDTFPDTTNSASDPLLVDSNLNLPLEEKDVKVLTVTRESTVLTNNLHDVKREKSRCTVLADVNLGGCSSLSRNESLLLEDEEDMYVIRDRNLSEISSTVDLNSSTEIIKSNTAAHSMAQTPFDPLKHLADLSKIRLLNIETQTDHDVLLNLNSASDCDYTDGVNESGILETDEPLAANAVCHGSCHDAVTDAEEAAWCTIETQTCEDFCDIEQYLCSTTQTQTSVEVRGELFPELSFADTQTQTGLDLSPYLVHSHTQTYF